MKLRQKISNHRRLIVTTFFWAYFGIFYCLAVLEYMILPKWAMSINFLVPLSIACLLTFDIIAKHFFGNLQ